MQPGGVLFQYALGAQQSGQVSGGVVSVVPWFERDEDKTPAERRWLRSDETHSGGGGGVFDHDSLATGMKDPWFPWTFGECLGSRERALRDGDGQ